jgi:ribosomal protein S27E
MPTLQALQNVFSKASYRADYARAKTQQTCIAWGQPARSFRDRAALFEYKVSALCQQCQDQLLYHQERREERMKVKCISCGHEVNLDHWVFDHYSGPAKCFSCGMMMSVRTTEGKIISVDPLPLINTQTPMHQKDPEVLVPTRQI